MNDLFNAMNRWGGGGFQGVLASFGRPTVQHWTGPPFYPVRVFAPPCARATEKCFPSEALRVAPLHLQASPDPAASQ
jgi:hypothetical protein